jgi:hypothetical protein
MRIVHVVSLEREMTGKYEDANMLVERKGEEYSMKSCFM